MPIAIAIFATALRVIAAWIGSTAFNVLNPAQVAQPGWLLRAGVDGTDRQPRRSTPQIANV